MATFVELVAYIESQNAVYHLDYASLHLDGGHSPYNDSVISSDKCKHYLIKWHYSLHSSFQYQNSTKTKKESSHPLKNQGLRALRNYSNSIHKRHLYGLFSRFCIHFSRFCSPYFILSKQFSQLLLLKYYFFIFVTLSIYSSGHFHVLLTIPFCS